MAQYIVRRILGMVPTFLVLLFVVVGMIRLIPGNVVDLMLQGQAGAREYRFAAREVGEAESAEFTVADAGAIEEFEDEPVTFGKANVGVRERRAKDGVHLFHAGHAGEAFRELGRADQGREHLGTRRRGRSIVHRPGAPP